MNKEIIYDLKGKNDHAFGKLYKEYFGMVAHFVTNNKGKTEDAEDIFQDTMMVFLEKLRQDDFQLTASAKTYIMAIAKNLWLKKLRTSYREVELTDHIDKQFLDEINLAIEQEKTYFDKLQNLLHRITEHCKGLLHDMFFKEKNLEEIRKKYGYLNKHTLQTQKYKCVEQVKKMKEQEKL
jgi:RNA polymerase sigma factor (sigma-70 family)